MPRPVNSIQVLRPGVVRVFSGAFYTYKIDTAYVLLYKRGGKWTIDDSTLDRQANPGVTRQERAEIREAIRAVTLSPIDFCDRAADQHTILIGTKDGKGYQARKIKGKWQFKESAIVH